MPSTSPTTYPQLCATFPTPAIADQITAIFPPFDGQPQATAAGATVSFTGRALSHLRGQADGARYDGTHIHLDGAAYPVTPPAGYRPPHTFAAMVAVARRHAGMTAAEFDYSLATDGAARGYLHDAASDLLHEGHSTFVTGLIDAGAVMAQHYRPQRDEMIAAAKAKTYTGWSNASRGPIRYAS